MESICSEECSDGHCFLKDYVLQSGVDDRIIEQIACIHKFKYERSKIQGRDIGWENAVSDWVELGYAERFARVYDPLKSHKMIYREVMGIE